jgi:cytochrome c2
MRRLTITLAALAMVTIALIVLVPGEDAHAPRRHVDRGVPARGVDAIERYGCGSCHAIPGIRRAAGRVGPPLTSFARRVFIAGQVPNTPDYLVRWIVMPQSIEPGTAMPNLGVSDGDARDIAAYLYTLR